MSKIMQWDETKCICPVCLSDNTVGKSILSKNGFMSIADIWHSECKECGSFFVNPQPTNDALTKFYQSTEIEEEVETKILESSVERYFNADKKKYFIDNRVNPIKKYLRENSKIIDIGCGAGTFVRFMMDEGYTVEGIDISKRSIEYGIEKLNLKNSIFQGQWDSLEDSDNKYDLVTAWTLLEHLKEPVKFLSFTRRILKKDGLLLIEVPTVDSLMFKHMKENFFWVMPPYHLFLFSIQGLNKMLNRSGFEIIEEHRMPSNWNFVSSVCKKLNLSYEYQISVDSKVKSIFYEIDKVFDRIAEENNLSSSIQLICKVINK